MTTQANGGIAVPRKRNPLSDWHVDDLLLDSENPRLPTSQGPRSQDELLILIVKTYTIGELMESFAINGYFDEEPLVGVPVADDPLKLIIVEGNRRLSALKLLLDPTLVQRLVDPSNGRPHTDNYSGAYKRKTARIADCPGQSLRGRPLGRLGVYGLPTYYRCENLELLC